VTDLAICGDGFFSLQGNFDGLEGEFFSRAGQFEFDGDGFLVNPGGLRVQGYGLDGNGELGNTVGDIQVDSRALPPESTSNIEMIANLDADTEVSGVPFDIQDPGATSDFTTSVTAYDSLGRSHPVELYFTKTANAPTPQWEYNVVTGGADVNPPLPDDFALLGTGTMSFDANGALTDATLTDVNVAWEGANTETIQLDFGSTIASGGTGVDGITNYASTSSTTFLSQDGYSSGELAGIQISDAGLLEGLFTNGQSRSLGQVSVTRFTSDDGLSRWGGGMYRETDDSGPPMQGIAGTGGRGSLTSGSLESSNVDLASEFVNLISIQRGFQSNSKSISTADEMLSSIITLKR
jgi:flagellar hook protein FlgE